MSVSQDNPSKIIVRGPVLFAVGFQFLLCGCSCSSAEENQVKGVCWGYTGVIEGLIGVYRGYLRVS